ncbi:S8 family serine peptidase [Azospirillum sp. ST 5-10]|uniref:S8 family serine peptidase n=1 Tax=unclassified Azospirillum TaxID=2630922 RepID=UPI003F4A45A5
MPTGSTPPRANEAPRRWIVSHRLAHHPTLAARRSARARFDEAVASVLTPTLDLLGDNGGEARLDRRVLVCVGDAEDIDAAVKRLPPDAVAEPERKRVLAVADPPPVAALKAQAASSPELGTGSVLSLTFVCDGTPLLGAGVTVYFVRLVDGKPPAGGAGPSQVRPAAAVTDAHGTIAIPFDAAAWFAGMAAVVPAGRAWQMVLQNPANGATCAIPALPETGPLGWWHRAAGVSAFDAAAGRGVRIGVVDSGVGPHPYLSHVTGIGAFIDGGWDRQPEATRDVTVHGTHVCGIIGARPPGGSGAFGGFAPGAAIAVARVFPPGGDANQGDIANAIDVLSTAHRADLINMSVAGEASQIEADAVTAAFGRGTLCVCAAGNDYGQPVSCPAAYPDAVAITALGRVDAYPEGSAAIASQPAQRALFGAGGLYLAAFSNVGPQVAATAGGNGIVSTVPARFGERAPYADLSGTSMAAPATVGALAVLLARDAAYRSLPRTADRAQHARDTLARHAASVDLAAQYQGAGVCQA